MYKIMIVDDDPTSLVINKTLLGNEYEIVSARSGLQAMGYLDKHDPPDIVLLDMVMPGVSGMDVLKYMKSVPRLRDIPVLFITSLDDLNFEVEGFTLGAVDYMRKPVMPVLLKKKIERQINMLYLKRECQQQRDYIAKLEGKLKALGVPAEALK